MSGISIYDEKSRVLNCTRLEHIFIVPKYPKA